jgi:phospholipase C
MSWRGRALAVAGVLAAALLSLRGGAAPALRTDARFPLGTRAARPPSWPAALARQATPIAHVVFIVQENRSLDNLFQGYPGADTVPSGLNSKGQRITLQPIPLTEQYDMDNSSVGFFAGCDGEPPGRNCKMDGFDRIAVYGPHERYRHPQYGYVPRSESKPYFDIAQQYVLGDRTFTSQLDGSFVSHQYAIAGFASHAVNFPRGHWHCGGGRSDTVMTLTRTRDYGPNIHPCFENQTLGDELDAVGLTWRFYSEDLNRTGGLWSAYGAIEHIRYGPDWKNVIVPAARFLKDVRNGTLSNVTWITPEWRTSDHPSSGSALGPQWVTALVNAVGESQFWNTTAIFIMWDDWGGWYDHVPPPYEDYDGLGIRVPLLIVSAYAKRGYVTHVQYEQGSVLRFVEDNWGLAQLAASDARANDPANDAFDFSAPPRKFKRFHAGVPDAFFRSVHSIDSGGDGSIKN